MYKPIAGALLLCSTVATSETLAIKENSDSAITLSTNNYNRLVVKDDKITEAVFPPNSMAIKRDEGDGSVYVLLSSNNPFTLFLSTEKGHHFSITLSSEEALGKTIELLMPKALDRVIQTIVKTETKSIDAIPNAIVTLLTAMEKRKPVPGIEVKKSFGKVERWKEGLTLLPKESWQHPDFEGEIVELYNNSSKPISLSQDWFVKAGTLAIRFSKATIAPKEHVMLYRIREVSYG